MPGHSDWRSNRAEAGGGALLEHSIHSCDILIWLFGPVARVYATTRSMFGYSVEDAATRMLAISEEESRVPRAEDKWSPKEIVGHLIDSASNNHQRFVRAQFTDHLVFPGYEQESWVRAQGYRDEPWPLLVELWRSFNLHLAHVMERSPEAARIHSEFLSRSDLAPPSTVAPST